MSSSLTEDVTTACRRWLSFIINTFAEDSLPKINFANKKKAQVHISSMKNVYDAKKSMIRRNCCVQSELKYDQTKLTKLLGRGKGLVIISARFSLEATQVNLTRFSLTHCLIKSPCISFIGTLTLVRSLSSRVFSILDTADPRTSKSTTCLNKRDLCSNQSTYIRSPRFPRRSICAHRYTRKQAGVTNWSRDQFPPASRANVSSAARSFSDVEKTTSTWSRNREKSRQA
ncbi:unnamed protein product [Trichogramma brassicae]|uniref:Uncharacterized protein n=1 Tax=Trichogramma brassicae TaxID=86971 RepID=A0A6H5IYE8_9HYME|nr:unnamed protein product [Trichogramma brassicae]